MFFRKSACQAILAVALLVVSPFAAIPSPASGDVDAALRTVADTYLDHHLRAQPMSAYFANLPLTRHDGFTANSPEELTAFNAVQDITLLALGGIDPSGLGSDEARLFRLQFMDWLAAQRGTRICRRELWSVDHMFGTHAVLQRLVSIQPVATAEDRNQAIDRWEAAACYFDQEIDNLKAGLAAGYSAPKSVVDRVLSQLRALENYATAEHPYLALAQRAGDDDFRAELVDTFEKRLRPAMVRYRQFLADQYRSRAREQRAIAVLPRGRECYMALYRSYTTLSRTPEEVHETGLRAVNANRDAVVALGKSLYGVNGYDAAVAAANQDPGDVIPDPQAFHAFLETVVARSREASTRAFSRLPTTPLVVSPFPEFQQGKGVSAHYVAGVDGGPGKFAYDPQTYGASGFGSAEILAIHEGYPGHHLQIALSHERETWHPLENLFANSAYIEGWARYAESLAEELDVYQADAALILRRTWPARGMVLDTGLHVLGWSREQLVQYMSESGRTVMINDPDQMLDRMAVIPAQLTSYDSGALELFRLRSRMQAALGDDFDLKRFHRLVLEDGSIPLELLRARVERAIAAGRGEKVP